ncbi:hypothetical protein [Paraburkholderia tropica]|uniref:hypothetical protein n=1 Tax=Paraburkholderia tropica TaxID=92647 RepID=UPI001CC4E0E6|nr:hypothetical protein [Paraburkholderia tropica]
MCVLESLRAAPYRRARCMHTNRDALANYKTRKLHAMKKLLLTALCFSTTSAFAASQVLLETPVTYAPGASVVEQIKDECHIEDMLTRHVGAVLRKINRTGDGTISSQVDAGDARILRLQITHVLGVGGGAWSGPKATTVSADLIENGKVIRHTKINRWSVGGVWGAFKGSCSILDRTTIVISKDLSRWVRDPSYVIKEEEPPKEASAPAAQTDPASAVTAEQAAEHAAE